MRRVLLAIPVYFLLGPVAKAQDMPLSQILIDGEGWKVVSGNPIKPKSDAWSVQKPGRRGYHLAKVTQPKTGGPGEVRMIGITATNDGPMEMHELPASLRQPAGLTLSPEGGTLFVGDAAGGWVWIFRIDARGALGPGNRFCPLRLPETGLPSGVNGLTTDRDGRIYAATPIGVQVFDPTGRMCGVLTPAAPGMPELLAFEADKLTLWIGNVKYERKLNTLGAK